MRWECLANLVPSERKAAPSSLAPELAASEVRRVLARAMDARIRSRQARISAAKRDLTNLPVDLTLDIADRRERITVRDQLAASAERRLAQLEELCKVEAEEPRLVARLQVVPGPDVNAPLRRQADAIAVNHVRRLLEDDGWTVEDTRAEGRGFDLRAIRGQRQRLATAKGLWHAVDAESSTPMSDIRLGGDELLMAAQHRGDYVLYVIESCQDGGGSLFGIFSSPLDVFPWIASGEAVAHLSCSDLLAAEADAAEPIPGQEAP